MTYVQNEEQTDNSLWNLIKIKRETEEFKSKDYLRFVYAKGHFEDFQYDPETEQDLDKFIKDIKENKTSFSDYTNDQLKVFSNKIYDFRKNKSYNTP